MTDFKQNFILKKYFDILLTVLLKVRRKDRHQSLCSGPEHAYFCVVATVQTVGQVKCLDPKDLFKIHNRGQ